MRVAVAVAITAALATGGLIGQRWWASPTTGSTQAEGTAVDPKAPGAVDPWFGAYVDVTATPAYDFVSPSTSANRNVVLSSIVSSPVRACTPTWGAVLTLDEASARLDLDRKIARLRQQGRGASVSFGGELNDELATTCTDVDELAAAYASVADRYQISTIDLDVEGRGLSDRAAGQRRAQAITKLQQDRKGRGKTLTVWMTLPVSPAGLTRQGELVVGEMLRAGVELAGVNVMTMNYSGSRTKGQSMLAATTSALTATQRQLKALYQAAGTTLSNETAWSSIGATPMIGQNDVPDDVFGLDAAKGLNSFVVSRGVGRTSMWTLNRDIACRTGQVGAKRASPSCSGVLQNDRAFAKLLSAGLTSRM